ncbi:MAG TPA: hypothetical protein VMR54_08030 [Thermoanaerobaculia bacterium]|nr:hypothetical protein [Thermoanaerobaculia bacterium]
MEPERDRSNLLFRRGRVAILGAAAFFVFVLAVEGQTADAEKISILGVKNPFLVSAANNAFALALQRLANPGCQRIFRDFHDAKGRTLQARLDSLDHTGASFLQILRFANGERLSPCQSGGVLAATTPLSHVIFLCGIQFFERERHDPEFAAALVIHEMLHSLGLGENPPASNEITMRVLERCGSAALGEPAAAIAWVRRPAAGPLATEP